MNTPLPEHLQTVVEHICSQGCEQVNQCINELQHGNSIAQTRNLSREDQHTVLQELVSIMAVYQK